MRVLKRTLVEKPGKIHTAIFRAMNLNKPTSGPLRAPGEQPSSSLLQLSSGCRNGGGRTDNKSVVSLGFRVEDS